VGVNGRAGRRSARPAGSVRNETSGPVTRSLLRGRRAVAAPVVAATEVLFDRAMGINTRGKFHNESELSLLAVGGDPIRYEGAHLWLWWRWANTIPIDRGRATFVDLGAGRGRALILAAETGYRRVVGVELDERLVRQAEENLRRWRTKRRTARRPGQQVEIVHGDAATYRLPAGSVVVSLYNPFGPATLRHVLRQITERPARPEHPVFVAYVNPVHRSIFDEFPRLLLHAHAKRWSVYRLDGARPET
jgi:SAM-dependent methyltransferase